MFNPYDEVQRNRLFKPVESSFRSLEWARNLNQGLVEAYIGSGYGRTSKVRHETVINLMNQTVDAYQMCLVANRPRVLISTPHQQFTYFARHFQEAINNLIAEIGLEYTLRQWVLDAFFCVGVIKVHMADSGLVMLEENLWADPGTPFASNMSIDNWVYDMGSTKWQEVKFAGDMYRLPHGDLESGIFDQEASREVLPTSKYHCDADRLARISKGYEVDYDEFEPMVDLADVWIPRENKIFTFAVDSVHHFRLKGSPLAVMDWNGAEFGPYHLLGFNDVPENIMPVSPASHLASMDRLINNIARKQSKRARSKKRVNIFDPLEKDAADRIRREADEAWVASKDPKAFSSVETGGVDPSMQAFMLGIIEMYDRMAGNLTAMMGLGAQADTATQEQLIHGAVSKKEASMQYRVVDGSVKLIRDLGYMLWNDKFKVLKGQIAIDGAEGYSADATWTPEDREGDFFDYNFNIDLYSMPYQSPGQKVQALNQLITQIYAPMADMMAAQGGMMNLQKITEIYADMLNLPQLKQVIQFTAPMEGGMPGPQDRQTPKPAATTRTVVRKNIPTGGTAAGRSHVQQQAWMGMSPNAQQSASLTVPMA